MDSTGERRDIAALDPLTDHVSEIVTFSSREYYSLRRVFGSVIIRANRAVGGNHDLSPLLDYVQVVEFAKFRKFANTEIDKKTSKTSKDKTEGFFSPVPI